MSSAYSIDNYYTNVICQLNLKTEFITIDLMERVKCITNLDIKTLYKIAREYIFIQKLRTRFLGLITEELNTSLKARNILRVCCFSSTYFILFIPIDELHLFSGEFDLKYTIEVFGKKHNNWISLSSLEGESFIFKSIVN